MSRIRIPPTLREQTGGERELAAEGDTVRDLLDDLMGRFPALRQQLTRTVALSDGTQAVSALLLPYLNRIGQHGFASPQPDKPFNMDQFMANLIGRFFECRGHELHFEPCQQDLASCPWIPQPP